jgi:hypothetical protein
MQDQTLAPCVPANSAPDTGLGLGAPSHSVEHSACDPGPLLDACTYVAPEDPARGFSDE